MATMDRPTDEPNGRPREPGDPRRRLDRAPGERIASEPDSPPDSGRAPLTAVGGAARAIAIGAIGAVLFTVLGGPLSVTAGLIAVAAVAGWAIGSFVRPRISLAVGIAIASVVVGLIGIWIFARSEGGVLDIFTYLADVHGPLVIVEVGAAAVGAWLAARPESR